VTARSASEMRPASKRPPSTDTHRTAAKPPVKTSNTTSVSPRKQPMSDSRARDAKQVRKVGSEDTASKPAESRTRVARRSTADRTVSAAKSHSADLTNVRSPRRSDKPASRSSSRGRQVASKPLQRSATDLAESTQQSDSWQHSDEKVSIIVMLLCCL